MPTTEEVETMTFEAACEVLGVTEEHTTYAVRDAYRLIEVRNIRRVERNPDEVYEATLAFQQARRAREVLLEQHYKRFAPLGEGIERILPGPETHQVGELTVTVNYEWLYYGPLVATMSLTVEEANSLTDLPDPIYAFVHKITVVSGTEEARTFHINGTIQEFRNEYGAAQRQAERVDRFDALKERILAAERIADRMYRQGYPVDKLRGLLRAANAQWADARYSTRHGTFGDVEGRVKAVEAEIERINANRLEVLIDELMEGAVFRTLAEYNRIEIGKINTWSIRTGGFVDYWTDQELRDFYVERCTKHHISTRDGVRLLQDNLRVIADDTVSDELMVELCELGEFDVAPSAIDLKTQKGTAEYPLSFQVIDGVPEALLTIPLRVYEKNRPEYGKPSSGFPELPHGIRYRLVITQDGREITRGLLDEIETRLTKRLRGQQRGKNVPDSGYETDTPPSWYKRNR